MLQRTGSSFRRALEAQAASVGVKRSSWSFHAYRVSPKDTMPASRYNNAPTVKKPNDAAAMARAVSQNRNRCELSNRVMFST